jgi:hypothetical protein
MGARVIAPAVNGVAGLARIAAFVSQQFGTPAPGHSSLTAQLAAF